MPPSHFQYLIGLLLTTVFSSSHATIEQADLTFEDLYQFGKDAYTANHWRDCISFMRSALEDFEYYESELSACASRCVEKVSESPTCYSPLCALFSSSQRALCILRCRQSRLTERRPPLRNRQILHDFQERVPYRYLQICYWKDENLEMAVKSSYTFLVANPGHQETIENLNFYMQDKDFHERMLVDLLRSDYERMLISGIASYDEGDWHKCISDLETTLEEFWKEERKCRLVCRHSVEWKGVHSDSDIDVILSIKRGQDAASAVANYLLFKDEPEMRWNKLHYSKIYPSLPMEQLFQPDPRVLELAGKRLHEKRVLEFAHNRFHYVKGEYPSDQADDYTPLDFSTDSLRDSFPYAHVSSLLSPSICLILRAPLPHPLKEAALSEATFLLSALFGKKGSVDVDCGGKSTAECVSPVVFSVEKVTCSQWQSALYHGCVLIFCERTSQKLP